MVALTRECLSNFVSYISIELNLKFFDVLMDFKMKWIEVISCYFSYNSHSYIEIWWLIMSTCGVKSLMRCRWTIWEFMDSENDINDDLMWNLTRYGWWIEDMLNDICLMDWINIEWTELLTKWIILMMVEYKDSKEAPNKFKATTKSSPLSRKQLWFFRDTVMQSHTHASLLFSLVFHFVDQRLLLLALLRLFSAFSP